MLIRHVCSVVPAGIRSHSLASVTWLVCLVVTLPSVGFQAAPAGVEGAGETDGFDVQRLDKINSVMNQGVADGRIAGCSALIFKGGEEVFFNTWGYQDLDKKTPLSRDTIFRIYSMTKPITSVAVMQLVEQGEMDLDDPVSKHLEEFKDLKVADLKSDSSENGKLATVDSVRPMTVRDLLRHTSGLSYGFFDRDHPVDRIYLQRGVMLWDKNIAETVKKLGEIPLKYQPGTRFEYSASTDVLGRLVEVVSGERFDRYLQKHVFDPLEMKDTHFIVPKEKRGRLAVMYRDNSEGGLSSSSSRSSRRFVSDSNEFFSGGGGLCSTIDDYLNFARMLADEGRWKGRQVVQPETLKEMFTNQLGSTDSPSRRFQFGLGFRISRGKSGNDYSWGGIAGTRFWVHPELNMVTLYMIQINPYGDRNFGNQVRSIAYGALEKEGR